MRLLGHASQLALTSLGLLLWMSPAHAELALATDAAKATVIDHAEMAYSFGDAEPVTWISLRVSQGGVAIVAGLPAGATSDAGLDAWLSALEDTASPRVLPPDGETDCGRLATPLWVSWPRSRGRAASTELTLDSADDVAATLESFGLMLAEPLVASDRYVVWIWEAANAPYTTKTLRIRGAPQPAGLITQLAFPVVVNALTRGAMSYAGERNKQVLDVTFVSGEHPTCDYRQAARDWLVRKNGPLLELRAKGPLFEWSIYDDRLTLAPLLHTYLSRAADDGALQDPTACKRQLSSLRDGATDGGRHGSECGAADDLPLAFGAVDPQSAVLVRLLAPSVARGVAAELFLPGGDPVTPLLRAGELDAAACQGLPEAPPSVQQPVGNGSVALRPGRESEEAVYDPSVVELAERDAVSVSCSDSPAPERNDEPFYDSQDSTDCSSDTGSSSESESTDCSSDTSSSSESESTDCSSDTSSSGDAGSETDCAADTSSSSSSDESCDTGPETDESDTGYDGDTCTGSAGPEPAAPHGNQAVPKSEKRSALAPAGARAGRPSRRSRLRLSSWSVAMAAMVLPIRRRKRQSRRDG